MARDPETTVKIKADDSDLKKVARSQKQAFNKADIREFTRAGKDLERQIGDILRRQIRLTDEMRKVEKGTDAYKKLAGELKTAGTEATALERTLTRVNQTLKRNQAEQDRARQRRQGFVGGMAQGLGVAQYIPTGAEQAPRIGGAMLGGGIRRAAGAVTAPFMTPGVAGMAQGFGGIPIVGGFISGALQASAGMFQQAAGFQRQAKGALFAQGAGYTPEQMAFRKAQGEIQVKKEKEFGEFMLRAAKDYRERQQRTKEAKDNIVRKTRESTAAAAGSAGGALSLAVAMRAERERRKLITPEELAEHAEGAITIGEDRRYPLKKRTDPELIRQVTKERIQAIRARARAQPTGLPGAGAGVEFGLSPQEMMGGFTQFMQARGGTYDDVRRSQFREQMAAQTGFGVSAQQAGQFARMGIRGGGGTGMGQGLAGVLRAAMIQGLRGSQVTEYLQSLVQLGQQAERTGVKLNVQEFTRSAATLTAAGLQGVQAQRVATGMQQAAMTVSQRGVTSPIDVLLARSAGFDPSQGPEGYARAMNKMAGGMTSDMMTKLMTNLTQGAGAGGFGPEMQALMLRRAMGRMGVQIGPGQATRLLSAYRGGGDVEMLTRAGAMIEEGEQPGAGAWLAGEAKARLGRGAPLAKTAAGLEAYQIGVGARAAKWVVPLERASAQAASAINRGRLPLKNFAEAVERATRALDDLMKGGNEGLMDSIKVLIDAIRGKNLPKT